ncbi:hypothetical protein NP233_g2731 [Leucocoprinus birnbaumii]|uniref:GH16 domain-containing protein n=1 Tax=Leucocoprinus birnbaumii TaxID=56174 RepID=A0AAD5VXW1_9AGAR|nr:hypothetical protein NP233_g2731 [Leucocoprinus birnbaumii]
MWLYPTSRGLAGVNGIPFTRFEEGFPRTPAAFVRFINSGSAHFQAVAELVYACSVSLTVPAPSSRDDISLAQAHYPRHSTFAKGGLTDIHLTIALNELKMARIISWNILTVERSRHLPSPPLTQTYRNMKPTIPLLFSSILATVNAGTYSLSDTVLPSSFLDFFNFEAIPDPTHGRVNYVGKGAAVSQGLVKQSGSNFIIRADSTNKLDPDGPGRDSVRLSSKNTYNNHVAVFDVHHMPQGCGTWPAIWEKNPNSWPEGGEIDIVEGVNDQGPNAATLHTPPGCSMPSSRDQTGSNTDLNCDATINDNRGCGVHFSSGNSYGPAFNNNGGGWYAVEQSPEGINVYFWPRNSGSVPDEVKHGARSVNTDDWHQGTPSANFPGTRSCDIDDYFYEHTILINLTFCGDWAGSVYGDSGCPGTCVDYVNNNPGAFKNAYFEFASIRVYE